MFLYHKTGLLLLIVISWLLWCSPSFAQVETLADKEYRQEARTYMVIPCLEEVGRMMIKAMDLEGPQVTGVEFFRVVASDDFEEIENGLIDVALEKTKSKPKNERMVWYKVGTRICVKAWKERMREKGMIPEMTQSIKALEPKNKPDNSISEEQSNSDTSVSAQAKRNAVKTCKESLQILGGKMSYGMLNACIEQELQAYQEFQRNYGN